MAIDELTDSYCLVACSYTEALMDALLKLTLVKNANKLALWFSCLKVIAIGMQMNNKLNISCFPLLKDF